MSVSMLMNLGAGHVDLDVLIPNSLYGGFHPIRTDFYIPNGAVTRCMVIKPGGNGNKRQMSVYVNFLQQYIVSGSFGAGLVNFSQMAKYNMMTAFPDTAACIGPGMPYSVDADGNTLLAYDPGANPFNPGDLDTRNVAAGFPNGQTGFQNGFENTGVNYDHYFADLGAYITSHYGLAPTAQSVAGHSSGAFNVNKIWLFQPDLFSHSITWAGPLANLYRTQAMPTHKRPHLSIQGYRDTTVGALDYYNSNLSHYYEDTWQQDPTHVTRNDEQYPERAQNVGGFVWFQNRVQAISSVTPLISDGVPAHVGTPHESLTWIFGTQQHIQLKQATHKFNSITAAFGKGSLFITAAAWVINT